MGSFWSNLNNSFGEGVRESNPLYRANHQRQTLTAFEQAQLDQQRQDHQDLLKQQLFQNNRLTRNDTNEEAYRQMGIREHLENAVSAGKAIHVDKDGTPLDYGALSSNEPTSPAQKAVGGFDFNNFMNASPSDGALTPTSIAGGAPAGSTGEPSGGGPSAPPARQSVQDALGLTTPGPLTGTPGGSPAGNTVATTVASRASSAQSGPLAQISQGSTTPSETAAGGGSGVGGAPLPSATSDEDTPPSFAVRPPDISTQDGNHYRFLSPQEQDTLVQHQARQNAKQQHSIAQQQVQQLLQIPEVAARAKADPNFAADLYTHAVGGYVPPVPTESQQRAQLERNLDAANQNGDADRANQIRTELIKQTPSSQGLTTDPATRLADAKRYAFTGTMPPGLGRDGQQSRQIREDATKFFGSEDPMANAAFYNANKKSIMGEIPVYDAISQYERTAGDNMNIANGFINKIPDTGSPIWNTPLRLVNRKALGDEDLAAYDAASRVVANEVTRITSMASQNPGVMHQKNLDDFNSLISSKDATTGQILKSYGVLTQDMRNRRLEAGQQIQDTAARTGKSISQLRDWFGVEAGEPQTPGTTGPNGVQPRTEEVTPGHDGGPPPSKLKPLTSAIRDGYVKQFKGDKSAARAQAVKDGYNVTKTVD